MKILFLTNTAEDYLPDSLLIGLRKLLGKNCIDFPKKEILYNSCPESIKQRVRGGAFTLYSGILADDEIERDRIEERVEKREFDLVIFGSIWRQYGLYLQLHKYLQAERAIILDGEDTPQVYPAAGIWWRNYNCWLLPRADQKFLYFKREWTSDSKFNLWHRLLPRRIRRFLPESSKLRQISFCIPEEKILHTRTKKQKTFARHLIDINVAKKVPGSSYAPVFRTELEYYQDLRISKFSVTTKRSGWDCLRHYEIAANQCVPCFKDLELKPKSCAPHGLIPGKNCLSYKTADELLEQISTMGEKKYNDLLAETYVWAKDNSATQRAKYLLNQVNSQ